MKRLGDSFVWRTRSLWQLGQVRFRAIVTLVFFFLAASNAHFPPHVVRFMNSLFRRMSSFWQKEHFRFRSTRVV
jgi:hypothetical protein